MNNYRDELYYTRGKDVLRCFDALLEEAELSKSASTRVSEYFIDITTIASTTRYNNYRFSLNELEASFDLQTDDIKQIELRDTSVHKKITFLENKTTLTYAKGQDAVGQNSEVNHLTSRETVYSINVNGQQFISPNSTEEGIRLTDLEAIYFALTGFDLSTREDLNEEDATNKEINWWTAFLNLDKNKSS